MSKNITIAGASYSDVPTITVPDTAGGLARFVDVSDTTATAADVATGKQFYGADGGLVVGTASGGGSAGGAGDCLTVDGAVLDDSAFTGTGKTLYSIPYNIKKIESSAIVTIAARELARTPPVPDKLTSLILSNVTEIGDYGLARRELLTNCTMPLLTKVGRSVFSYCNNLIPVMPKLAETGDSAFQHCFTKGVSTLYKFDSLALPGRGIFDYAFKEGDTLVLPALQNMISSLVKNSKLSTIEIGPHVETAWGGSIWLYNGATNVIIRTSVPPVRAHGSSADDFISFKTYQGAHTGHIYVPDDSVEAYKTADGWANNADDYLPLSAYPG